MAVVFEDQPFLCELQAEHKYMQHKYFSSQLPCVNFHGDANRETIQHHFF